MAFLKLNISKIGARSVLFAVTCTRTWLRTATAEVLNKCVLDEMLVCICGCMSVLGEKWLQVVGSDFPLASTLKAQTTPPFTPSLPCWKTCNVSPPPAIEQMLREGWGINKCPFSPQNASHEIKSSWGGGAWKGTQGMKAESWKK